MSETPSSPFEAEMMIELRIEDCPKFLVRGSRNSDFQARSACSWRSEQDPDGRRMNRRPSDEEQLQIASKGRGSKVEFFESLTSKDS